MRENINFCLISLVFSPAPTLLEQQQENLLQRIKSYKSLQGFTSAYGANASETTTENGKQSPYFPTFIRLILCQTKNMNLNSNRFCVDGEWKTRTLQSTSRLSTSNSSLSSLPSTDSLSDADKSETKHNHIDADADDVKEDTERDVSTTPPLPMSEYSTSTAASGEAGGKLSPSENTSR